MVALVAAEESIGCFDPPGEPGYPPDGGGCRTHLDFSSPCGFQKFTTTCANAQTFPTCVLPWCSHKETLGQLVIFTGDGQTCTVSIVQGDGTTHDLPVTVVEGSPCPLDITVPLPMSDAGSIALSSPTCVDAVDAGAADAPNDAPDDVIGDAAFDAAGE